jgi:hypothetical protein
MKTQSIVKGLLAAFLIQSMAPVLIAQTEQKRQLPQFLFEKFTKGIIKMKAGNTYSANLNYNLVDEEMVFEQKGTYMVLDKPEDVDTVFLQNRAFVYFDKAFYEVVLTGKIAFYLQNKSKYVPVAQTTAYGMTSQTLRARTVTGLSGGNQYRSLDIPEDVTISPASMSWVKLNGTMEKFNSTGQLIKLFPGLESELKKYIKTNKPDLKLREDLLKIGIFINELQK